MRSIITLSAVALLAASTKAHVVEQELVQAYADEKEDMGNMLIQSEMEEEIDHEYLNELLQDHTHNEDCDEVDHDHLDEMLQDVEEVDHDAVNEMV